MCEKNAITGNIVCAKVRLEKKDDPKSFSIALKKFCRERLQTFKIPVKVEIVDQKQHNERFKKIKRLEG